ncbi:MAG: extracellular solute-binding protein, partial [Eubacteriales bacterium]|nr:extracellular solute-binding protein [Eubacteriales bacterium]
EKLGENYAATKLPEFNMGGTQAQMSSFAGFKLVGVSSQTQAPVAAMELAEWLTNEENQIKRFEARQMGPANINAANSEEVKANVALAALAEQNQHAVSQKEVLGGYWGPAEAFGTAMEAKDYSKTIQEMLDEMVAQIQG